jgi:hypothetical protein
MHQIDTPGAVDGLFVNPNPETGQIPVVVDAAWLNDVQQTIIAPIAAAGIDLVKGNYGQLLAALVAGFGLAMSLAANGYITLPGGLILQWGSYAGGASNPTITMDYVSEGFPNACFGVFASPFSAGSTAANRTVTIEASEVGTGHFSAFCYENGAAADDVGFFWLAIGN